MQQPIQSDIKRKRKSVRTQVILDQIDIINLLLGKNRHRLSLKIRKVPASGKERAFYTLNILLADLTVAKFTNKLELSKWLSGISFSLNWFGQAPEEKE